MSANDAAHAPTQTPITKEFLEKVLKRKVVTFKTSEGSNFGDNFTSVLISLEIVVEDAKEPLHLLFKTFPSHPTRQKMLEDTNLFLKEYLVYDIYLKELVNFQKSIPGIEKTLIPAMPELVAGSCIDYINGDPKEWKDLDPMLSNFILMVDVRKTHGFKMANKLHSLGYDHVKLVLEELAKYHALGHAYKIHNKLPTAQTKFPFIYDTFFGDADDPVTEALMKGNLQLLKDTCKDLLEEKPKLADSLNQFVNDTKLAPKIMRMSVSKEGIDEETAEGFLREKPQKYSSPPLKEQWMVTAHGDFWTNNMLFKHDENGNVTQAILVDLQVVREACIMADLSYFMYTSTDTAFRKQHLDEMLRWYHERFAHFCAILKVDTFPGFTLENFQRKFHRSKIFGFLFAMIVLPIIMQKSETAVNLDKAEVKGENYEDDIVDMFQNLGRDKDDLKMLKGRFSELLLELHEEGVL